MTKFEEAFVDASAFLPPGKWLARASQLLVLLTVAMLLVGGWFFRDWLMSQFQYLALSGDSLAIPFPAQWQDDAGEGDLLRVVAPVETDALPPAETVTIHPLPAAPIAKAWPAQRSQSLPGYHQIAQSAVALLDGRPALLLTYAYIANHAADDARAPEIIQAQDIAFETSSGRLAVITLSADANAWAGVQPAFRRIWRRLGVEEAP